MNSSLQRIPKPARFAAGAAGGFVVAVAAVIVTAQAAGFHLDLGGKPVAAAAAPSPAASPLPAVGPSPAAMQSPAAASRRAIVAAEAQVLGLKPKDLTADIKGGQKVAQLAQAKGLSQDQFRAALIAAVQASPSLPAATQQALVRKLQSAPIPNW
jgi:hypothetical protein